MAPFPMHILIMLAQLACSAAAAAATMPAAKSSSRRNVVLVVFDDLRAAHNVYGWRQPATPAADAFAKDALVFDRV